MRDLLENIWLYSLAVFAMTLYAIYGHKNFNRLFEKLADLENNG